MDKRDVAVDDDLLRQACAALGTTTPEGTVEAALTEVVKAARRRAITKEDLMRVGKLFEDALDPEIRAKARH